MLDLLAPAAPSAGDVLSRDRLHRILDEFNRWRLSPGLPTDAWDAREDEAERTIPLELRFVESERAKVVSIAAEAPRDPEGFVAWFQGLKENGPGQRTTFFSWLETEASFEDVRWFLHQEVAGEAGFEDLVALTQIKMPTRAKLELGRNYWDEMGQGHPSGMHGPLLGRLATELGVGAGAGYDEPLVWESLALGNLMAALAVHRRYAYHSVGALGVIELTAPGRAVKVNAALKRLGIAGDARRYFALHATLDVKHSAAWNAEVIGPLVAENPALAQPIAEGALLRLSAGARCFERYQRQYGLPLRSSPLVSS